MTNKYTRKAGWKIVEKPKLPYIDKALAKQLAEVEIYESYQEALSYAFRGCRDGYYHQKDEALENAYSVIRGKISENLNNAYRNVMMFGLVTNSVTAKRAAKRIAYNRFLKDAYDIGSWLGRDFSYKVSDKNAFRKELHQHARREGLRGSLMDDRSIQEDLHNMKKIIKEQKERIAQLESTLETVHTLAP